MVDTSRQGRRRAGLELVLVSFAVLFQELTLIRWLGGQVRVLAYFPNVVLMSAFLGLGIGGLRARRPAPAWVWPATLLVVVAAAWGLSRVAFTQESVSEHLWLLYYDMRGAPVVHGVRLPILAVFVLSGASFVVPGQMVARRLEAFRGGRGEAAAAAAGSLWGYVADLSGSLLGVAAFAAASFLRTPPAAWFGVILLAVAGVAWVSGGRGRAWRTLVVVACGCLLLTVVAASGGGEQYSPYYAVRRVGQPGATGFKVLVNGSLHQYALPVRRADVEASDGDRTIRDGYHAPYRSLARPPRRVLVLGAGTGNDVATALDEGAEQVDAVEIDPVILALGRRDHPDRPYASPRVRAFNTDARNFLNGHDDRYDLIVFGTLDSMTRLSALSSVRLDNFVYTADCLAAARRHLTPDGGVMMYFMVGSDFIGQRLWHMLDGVFGRPPVVQAHNYAMFNTVFMGGPAFAVGRPAPAAVGGGDDGQVPTDDWPYLYLRHRGVSGFYLSLIAAMAALAVAGVAAAAPGLVRRAAAARSGGFDAEMFLFGVAFLLLETRSVTEMNLVWGVTWLTSAVVFGSILLMLLLATVAVQVRPLPWWAAAAGLVASLAAGYLVPVELLVGRPVGVALVLSAACVGVPIFFASVCFALRFRTRHVPDAAFAWNLLGAVGGGLLEFTSMAVGCRALSLLAVAIYLLAFALGRARRAAAPRPEPAAAAAAA